MTATPKLGLVCISELLKDKDKKIAFKTMTRKQFLSMQRQDAIKELSFRILHNSKITAQIIVHCASVGISHYRVSSNLFPLVTDETLDLNYSDLPDLDQIKNMMMLAGNHARKVNITISSHPDQFNVLSSYTDSVVDKSIRELNHQSYILDLMGCSQDHSSPMCLHVSKNPNFDVETIEQYCQRFMNNLSRCDIGVQKRLVVENEDNGYWNSENVFKLFGNHLPCVFDNLHDAINPSVRCYINDFKSTWKSHTPVMHWSEGINKTKSHTDYASHVPHVVSNNLDCIWEVELKAKDKSIVKILSENFKSY
jgi:UV DNA damage endonuclease